MVSYQHTTQVTVPGKDVALNNENACELYTRVLKWRMIYWDITSFGRGLSFVSIIGIRRSSLSLHLLSSSLSLSISCLRNYSDCRPLLQWLR